MYTDLHKAFLGLLYWFFTAVASLALHLSQVRLKEILGITQAPSGQPLAFFLLVLPYMSYSSYSFALQSRESRGKRLSAPSISRFLLWCLPFLPYVWRPGWYENSAVSNPRKALTSTPMWMSALLSQFQGEWEEESKWTGWVVVSGCTVKMTGIVLHAFLVT